MTAHLHDRCVLLSAGERYQSKQGHTAFRGITRQSVGALQLGMHVVEIPPGGRALPHVHPEHESAIYLIKGTVEVWHGNGLLEYFIMGPGDMVYIPPGVPHLPINSSHTDMVIALVARTDPDDDEDVTLLPAPEHVQPGSPSINSEH
jgi:uncharacterized RmlC-like cupin family protein